MPLYDYDDVLDFLNMYEEHLQQSRNKTPSSSLSSSSPRPRASLRRVVEPPSPSLSTSRKRKRSSPSPPPPAVASLAHENRPLTRQLAHTLGRTLPDISTLPVDPEKIFQICGDSYADLGVGLSVLNIEEDQALREQIKEAQNTCLMMKDMIRSISSEEGSSRREVELKKLQKDVNKLKEKAQALTHAALDLLPGPSYRVTPPPETPPRQKNSKRRRRVPPRRPPPEPSTSTSPKTTQPMPPVHRPWTRSMGPVPK